MFFEVYMVEKLFCGVYVGSPGKFVALIDTFLVEFGETWNRCLFVEIVK